MSPAPSPSGFQDDNSVALTIHSNIEQLRLALRCPLCLSTLTNPAQLPCVHAFCLDCITQSMRRNQECPTCRMKFSKRSISQTPALQKVVYAYRSVCKSFGVAPTVWSPSSYLTQPEAAFEEEEGSVTLSQQEEQYALSSVLQRSLAAKMNEATKEDGGGGKDAEEMRRLEFALKQQERIVNINEKNRKERKEEEKEEEKKENEEEEVNKKVEKEFEKEVEKENQNGDKIIVMEKDEVEEMERDKDQVENKVNDGGEEHVAKMNVTEEVGKTTDKEIDLVMYSQSTDSKNNEKKNKPLHADHATTTSSTTTSSSTTTTTTSTTKATTAINTKHYAPLSLPSESIANPNPPPLQTPKTPHLPLPPTPSSPHITPHVPTPKPIPVGSTVVVQRRSWAGVNKQGGVAKVMNITNTPKGPEYDVKYMVGTAKEMKVEAKFVEPVPEELRDDNDYVAAGANPQTGLRRSRRRSTTSASTSTAANSSSPQPPAAATSKKSTNKKVAATKKTTTTATTTRAATPQQNIDDSETPERGRKLKLSESKKKRRANRSRSQGASKSQTAVSLKCSSSTQPSTSRPPSKRARSSPVSSASPDFNVPNIVNIAASRYKRIVDGAVKSKVLNFVTSALDDKDNEELQKFERMLSQQHGMKTMQCRKLSDSVALCVASSKRPKGGNRGTPTPGERHVASKRTLKVMTAVALGIPIVSTSWISECLRQGKIIEPAEPHVVNTIPTKGPRLSQAEELGEGNYLSVSLAAANLEMATEKQKGNLFKGTSVHLLGDWSKTVEKNDLTSVLNVCGASTLGDPGLAARLIEKKRLKKKDAKNVDRILLICDDATSDAKCGLKGELLNVTQNLIGDGGTFVTLVHQGWVFDAISCYKADLEVDNYPPKAPLTRGLFEIKLEFSRAK